MSIEKLKEEIKVRENKEDITNDDLHDLFHLYDQLEHYDYYKNKDFYDNQVRAWKEEMSNE